MDGRQIINAEDQFLLGYALPHSTGGIGNTFRYRNWTLNVYMDYALGHSVRNDMQMRYFQSTMGNCNYNLVNEVKKCWSQPGDDTRYARFTANDTDWGNRNYGRTSDIFVEKADYLLPARRFALVVAPEGVAAQTAHKPGDAHRLGQHALLLDGRARGLARGRDHRRPLHRVVDLRHRVQSLPADAQSALHGQTHVLTPYCHENEIRKDYSRSRAAVLRIRGGRLSRRPGHHAGQQALRPATCGKRRATPRRPPTGCTSTCAVRSKSMNDIYLCWGELRNGLWGRGRTTRSTASTSRRCAPAPMSSVNEYADWTALYTTVNQANLVIRHVPAMGLKEKPRAFCLGNAHFIRAYCFFQIARIWGDAPLPLWGYESTDTELFLGRTPVSEVLMRVERDIADAERYVADTSDKTVATPAAVAMLKADYALWMYRMQAGGEAYLAMAQEALGELGLSDALLEPAYADIFSSSNKCGREVIFAVHQDVSEALNGPAYYLGWNESY